MHWVVQCMHHNLVVLELHPKNFQRGYCTQLPLENPLKHEVICITTLHWTICLALHIMTQAIQQITST